MAATMTPCFATQQSPPESAAAAAQVVQWNRSIVLITASSVRCGFPADAREGGGRAASAE
jgi:hypothetical protein